MKLLLAPEPSLLSRKELQTFLPHESQAGMAPCMLSIQGGDPAAPGASQGLGWVLGAGMEGGGEGMEGGNRDGWWRSRDGWWEQGLSVGTEMDGGNGDGRCKSRNGGWRSQNGGWRSRNGG